VSKNNLLSMIFKIIKWLLMGVGMIAIIVATLFCIRALPKKEKSIIVGKCMVEKHPSLDKLNQDFNNSFKNVEWKDISIEFRAASMEPVDGFVSMENLDPFFKKSTYYVSPKAGLGIKDFRGMNTYYIPDMEKRLGLIVYLDDAGSNKFEKFTADIKGKSIAIVIDGKLMKAMRVITPIRTKRIDLGDFESRQALDVLDKYFKPLGEKNRTLCVTDKIIPQEK